MKTISLVNGKGIAKVDDEDYEYLSSFKWYLAKRGYAIASVLDLDGRRKTLTLHRLIMDCPQNMVVDHIDHDTSNDSKNNLRVCTRRQNSMNVLKTKLPRTSKYKGVSKENNRWRVSIGYGKERLHIGNFDSETEAAEAYNAHALIRYGEYAVLN